MGSSCYETRNKHKRLSNSNNMQDLPPPNEATYGDNKNKETNLGENSTYSELERGKRKKNEEYYSNPEYKELEKNKKIIEEKRKKIIDERIKIKEEDKKRDIQEKIEEENRKLEEERKRLEEEKERNEEKKKFQDEKRKIDEERKKIEQERQKIEKEKKKIQEEKEREKERKLIEENKKLLEEEKLKFKEEKELEEKKRIEEEEKKKNSENRDFYDMILEFTSFEQLKKEGWKAKFTKNGKKKYDRCLNEKNIVIGIVGNKNRGKSYLLGRIMDMKEYENPHGFLVTTYGISCIFPQLANNAENFITLDTAGRDNPLLQTVFFEDNDKNELIRNIARDQKVTEIALNDFIIQESDVIITVLEQLSFAEQELLKNLINQLKENKINKENRSRAKRLIVIHNLMNISSNQGIKEFIDDILLKSLTFSLRPQSMSNSENQNNDVKRNVYIQKTNDNNLEIIHVIVGNNDVDEIKKEYNEPAFRYIRKNIKTATAKKFDIINEFKQFIKNNYSNYIQPDNFEPEFSDESPKDNEEKIEIPIKLKNSIDKINLKRVFVNAKGIHNFSSALEPLYTTNLICLNKKFCIEVEFEMFGKIKDKIDVSRDFNDEKYIISIKGKTIDDIDLDKEKDLKIVQKGISSINEFDFQVIINRTIPLKEENNKEMEIDLSPESDYSEEFDEKYGIYRLIFPIITKKIDISSSDDDEGEDKE